MKQMLKDYGLAQSSFLVYCDNMSAIDISKNLPLITYSHRSKSTHCGMDAIPAIPRVPRSRPNPSVSMTTNSLFVLPEAATFYQEVVSKRKFVAERSYTLDALPTEAWCDTSQLFTHYKLRTLNALSRKFNASAIKEFYSNLPADPQVTNFCVFVRNVPLIVRPSLINRTLCFRSYSGLDYAQFSVALSQYTIALFRTVA
ncbi:unnamed protein product, partial [Prunus brigantina]